MTGIYKITNPNNRVYIGQSVNIKNRFYTYKKYGCKRQPILFKSFLKYGVDNHIFEIIEECNIELLNEKERYWQDYCDINKIDISTLRYKLKNNKINGIIKV